MPTTIKQKTTAQPVTRPARRRNAAQPVRRVTVSLPVNTAQQVREAVASGAATSQNDLARNAIEAELRRLRELEIRKAMQEAANDPLFMQDLEDTMRDWAELDADSLRYIDVEPQYPDEAVEVAA